MASEEERTSVDCGWELRNLTASMNICHCKLRFGDSAAAECAGIVAVVANCCSNCSNIVAVADSDVAGEDVVGFDVDESADC